MHNRWIYPLLFSFILVQNDQNEAQGQSAFAKTTGAIPCRLDLSVMLALFASVIFCELGDPEILSYGLGHVCKPFITTTKFGSKLE